MNIKIFKSGLLKNTYIYTISSLINASIPFFLIPILTNEISAESYGIIAMFTLSISFITPFIGFNGHGAVQRKYYDYKNDSDQMAVYNGNAIILLFASFLVLFVISFLLKDLISDFLNIPANWIKYIFIIAAAQFTTQILLVIWQVKLKPYNYGALLIIQSILNFSITVFLIYYLQFDWQGRIIGLIVASLSAAAFSLLFLIKKKWVSFKFNISDIKEILKFGIPLIPHTLGGLLFVYTDRLIINEVLGLKLTGIYTVSYQIGSILTIVTTAINYAYVPWIYEKLSSNKEDEKIKIVKITYYYFAALLVFWVIFSTVAPYFISLFIREEYIDSQKYLPWILLGNVFNGMYLMVTVYLFYMKKTAVLAKITFITAILNIALTFYLTKLMGAQGAAISTAMVFFCSFVFTWRASNKHYSMPWSLKNVNEN